MNRACSHVYQIHLTPPAAFVGFRTVYSQAMDALHLLLYQIHQTPPAAFVGFRTVYSQAMDALHLLLYQFHQSPTIGGTFFTVLMDLGWFLAPHKQSLRSCKNCWFWEELVVRNATFPSVYSDRLWFVILYWSKRCVPHRRFFSELTIITTPKRKFTWCSHKPYS